MALNDLAADGQAHARALVLVTSVQALKDIEDAVEVLFVESDTIVFYDDLTRSADWRVPKGASSRNAKEFAMDLDDWSFVRPVELQGIVDQVLQQLTHLEGIGFNGRQLTHVQLKAYLLDLHFQIGYHAPQHVGEIDPNEGLLRGPDPSQSQQIADQPLHPFRRIPQPLQVILPLGAERLPAFELQLLPEELDLAQRLLEIVRSDGGELLQSGIGALQLPGLPCQRRLDPPAV